MHDHSSLYAKVDIGQQMLATLRGCIEDHLLWAITDKQFDNGHVTIFRNNTMTDRELAPLLNSFKEYNISMMVARKVVLRVMKKEAEYRVRQRGYTLTHSARTPPAGLATKELQFGLTKLNLRKNNFLK